MSFCLGQDACSPRRVPIPHTLVTREILISKGFLSRLREGMVEKVQLSFRKE